MKNYIGFVNDHSASMACLETAALNDFNSVIESIVTAANREGQDTVVSCFGIGTRGPNGISREITLSNPHVLKPKTNWLVYGNTPLYDGIGQLLQQFKNLPDAEDKDVSFLIFITTDGQENGSKAENFSTIKTKIQNLSATGKWTFVFRCPKEAARDIENLGVSKDNIHIWETNDQGLEKARIHTCSAVSSYYSQRSAGATSSNSFFSNTSKVDTSALTDITQDVSLYVVPDNMMGIEIRDFILKFRMEYLKGAAFYQLTKTEPRVQHTKMIAIRDRKTGKVYIGNDARKMIGLPTNRNARLHPGDHGNYDLFIQSESINRKLVAGTGVLYYPKIGKTFTDADLAYLKPAVKKSGVVQLPKVPVSNKPTKSPVPVAKKPVTKVNGVPVVFHPSRAEARAYGRRNGLLVMDIRKLRGYTTENVSVNDRWYTLVA